MNENNEKKHAAIKLRMQGYSYNEIRRSLGMKSKSTVVYWLKDLVLPEDLQALLKQKQSLIQMQALAAFNLQRTRKIESENIQIREVAAADVGLLSRRDLFLVGIALYWGEGFQSERVKRAHKLSFVNSNPYMVALFLRFMREILGVNDTQITVHIHLYGETDQKKAIQFWHDVTKLPHERFRSIVQVSNASSSKRPTNSLPHGTLDVRVNSRRLFHQMKGYIDGLGKIAGWEGLADFGISANPLMVKSNRGDDGAR